MPQQSGLLKTFRTFLRGLGIDVVKYRPENQFALDIDEETVQTILTVKPFTMTSPERVNALCQAINYIVANNIPGDIVECGVWKGGSMMAAARTLVNLKDRSRHLHLFDTFEGMSEPSEYDVDFRGLSAQEQLLESDKSKADSLESIWCYSSLEEVKKAVYSVGYDADKIHFIKGKVEDTIPENAPANIALLRLDTDWYESTRHELIHLYPRISPGGVIIIDDYGYWQGARKAVDEYIGEHKLPLLLNRIDVTGRIGVVVKL